jgi:outer membrane protein OmpA-like peptidoglycan-associated protein
LHFGSQLQILTSQRLVRPTINDDHLLSFPALVVALALLLAPVRLPAQADSTQIDSSQIDSLTIPVNLGPQINSIYDEVLPVISPDGKTLFFDRTNFPAGYGRDDIWYSTLTPDGRWSPAKNIGPTLNNAQNNFVCSITPDGNTLLLGNVYNANGPMTPGASVVHRSSEGWVSPEKLVIKNFYSRSDIGNYYLANDGSTLLLAVQRDDGYGGLDLYVSFLEDDGQWSEPMNLGPDVNTSHDDRTPFLAADGSTLYFSSEGHGGFGSSDIFVSRRLDSSWSRWSRPENLGRPINSEGWDGFFTITASGDYAYLASKRNSYGANDIFRVELPMNMRPKSVVLISGRVLNAKTKEPLAAHILYETLSNGTAVGTARSNPTGGDYKIALPAGSNYGFHAEAPGFIAVNDNIDLTKLNRYQEINRDLFLVPVEVGEIIRLNNIFFDFGLADLRPESTPELSRVMRFLQDNPKIEIEISGHTDNVGTDADNLKLSRRRATAVYDFLVAHGVKAGRLTVQGYGKDVPVATNDTEEGRRQNRRVEFKIVRM